MKDMLRELALAGLVGLSFGAWQHSFGAGILAFIVWVRFAANDVVFEFEEGEENAL